MSEPTSDRPDDAASEAPNAADLTPAYFLSLTLENVRCFGPEQTLDLSDGDGNWAQWTVILGDNGTGKTTLLQSLSNVRGVYSERPDLVFSEGTLVSEPFARIKYSDLPGYVRGDVEFAKVATKIQCPPGVVDQHGDSVNQVTSRIDFNRLGRLKWRKGATTPSLAAFLVGFGSNRTMASGGFEDKDASGAAGLYDDTFVLPNAHDWLLQTDYAAKRDKRAAQGRLDQILDVLAHILPDVEEVQIKDQAGDSSLPKVEFHTPYGWVTMNQLSLGYRTMIAWIVDLARRLFERYPDMENPLEGAAVCLVDEIDLHLHPKWQRKIIGFLSERFPNTQFIVTAHSPLIVQAAQDANIAVLKRSDEPDETGAHYVEIHNNLEPLRNLRVDQILTSDLYGLDSARPPQMDEWMDERDQILAKAELKPEDIEKLERLSEKIGDLPTGETPDDIEAMNLIRRAAKRLENQ